MSPLAKASILVAITATTTAIVLATRRDAPPRDVRTTSVVVTDAPEHLGVFLGRGEGVDYVLRRRRSSTVEAAFVDAEFHRMLTGETEPPPGGTTAAPQAIELLALRRSGNPEASIVVDPPELVFRDGRRARARRLSDVAGGNDAPLSKMFRTALAPPENAPLPVGALRRYVYVLPEGLSFDDATEATVDGLHLRAARVRTRALDGWPEDARLSLEELSAPEAPRRVAEHDAADTRESHR